MNTTRKAKWFHLFLAFIITAAAAVFVAAPSPAQAAGATYYIDALGGNDANPGTAQATAWKTLEKVNRTVFQPGDSILFKTNGVWIGTLSPQGSGSSGNPIKIDQYGQGNKPLIAGGGVAAAVYFSNQEQWEVRNLEITNDAQTPAPRKGIHVAGSSGGFANPRVYQHFVFENLTIHNVKGDSSNDYAHNGGIIVWGTDWDFHVSDIVIKNNTIYAVDSVGIYLNGANRTYSSGLKVLNNVIYDVGADGAFILNTTDGLIEHNVVYNTHVRAGGYHVPLWVWGSKDAVIQYNEVYNTAPGGDAMAFDSDYNSTGTIIQYNYSHHNAGGFVLTVNDGTNSSNFNNNTTIRYNISQTDGGAVFNFNGTPNSTYVYNNTVYIPNSANTKIVEHGNWGGYASNTYFYNNLIYNLGTGGYSFAGSTNNVFEHNAFFGNHPVTEPADPYKLTADPKLASPGSGGIGRSTLVGYQLLSNSPAIGAGKLIAVNGGMDFFGNAVSSQTLPNIGAYQGVGLDPNNLPPLPEPPSQVNLLKNPGFETGDFTGWGLHYNGAAIVNSGARTGSYAAKLTGAYAGVEQNVTGLYPNTMYKLYAYGKGASSGSAVFGVKNHGGNEQSAYVSTTAYSRNEITFTTSSSSTSATIFLYKGGAAGEVTFDDLELIQFSAAPVQPEPVFSEGTDDEFNASALDSQWNWIRESSSKWSLADRPGFLRITSESGDIVDGGSTAKNILLTGAPEGDWTMETKLDGKPTSQWSQGGLIVYEDDNSYFRLTRLYGSGNQIQFTRQIDAVREHVEVPDTIASSILYMRIVKSGSTYSAYYSADGSSYQQIWTGQTAVLEDPKIGLIVCAGTGLVANFDYFHILKQPVNLLANADFEAGDFAAWNVHYNQAAIANINARTGNYAAMLTGDNSGMEQQVIDLSPNTTYKLSGYGQSVNGGVAVFGVKNYGGNALDAWGFEMTDGYTNKEVTFTTGSSNTGAIIYLYKAAGTGEIYFDDMQLVAVTTS
ncbi:MAG: carbohydrate binding domain-containing protein [Gorillibacterium sp.]|nr:carbohydrate binding domain-containing protein [Gorillibacterium sp.]